ncbi:MAG: aminopeptidase P family protein [Oscillospiraceae bacterium]|nr:aminopeptidase P family protein [Oscillospiraceae bacterium]
MVLDNLKTFVALMERYGLDAYIVTDSDPHSSEYTAGHWKARSWLSGFTGSNGTLVVMQGEAALWTDGRYYIQAERQLAGSGITLMRGGEPGVPDCYEWVAGKLGAGAGQGGGSAPKKVGVNGRTFSCAAYDELKKALRQGSGDAGGVEIIVDFDIAGEVWTEGRPSMPDGRIFCHDLRYTGKAAQDKVSEVRAELARRGASHTIICGLEDVAWLFNIRGSDIENLPVAYAYAFIAPDYAELFTDTAKIDDEVKKTLAGQGVRVADAVDIAARLSGLEAGDSISCDARKLSKWLRRRIPDAVRVIYADEPTVLLKAIKNDAEIRGHRDCQLQDGAAMVRFMMWVEREIGAGADIGERDAALALSRFRAQGKDSRGDSFNAIVGYGPNGAMMHYTPGKDGGARIKNAGLMVVDSGGQYPSGTTDVTRTIVCGVLTDEERFDFTLTLKSHIALASARILYGATGGHIDSIARKVMWDHGMDYKCGTGHGIGCYLSVHEGPQSISMRSATGARLEENMIVSIEPGVYREGKHGVRTENLARLTEDCVNEFGRFMRFEILSFCPIGLAGVDASMLDAGEREWLNSYHRDVYEKISPLLDTGEREWLANATREI